MQALKMGVVMDPIEKINIEKDTTFVLMLEAEKRGHELYYMELDDLSIRGTTPWGHFRRVSVARGTPHYRFGKAASKPLSWFDVILMRKDPPFDMEYVYTTYILDRAKQAGALIVNAPQALRDMNEKAYTGWFPDCTPITLITRSMSEMKSFLGEHERIVVKPLDGMGGRSIFVLQKNDNHANVVFETLTDYGQRFAMAQVYIPEIKLGDKRILIIDGEPVPYALARIPTADYNRGNIVAGATTKGQELSAADRRICGQVGPVLREQGVLFAGIDVIGDVMTEVNVTSPTGIRELDREFDLNIAGLMFDSIEAKLS